MRQISRTKSIVFALSVVSIGLSSIGLTATAAPIDDTRLREAAREAANWLHYGRDYTNQRFSPLKQIDADNVGRLVPKWIYQTGTAATFQTSPIIADGVMFISMPFSHVAAINARTGKEIWRYEHKRKAAKLCCGPANRGVSIGYGRVYVATVDARLVALDQKTGAVQFDIELAGNDADAGETEDLAQLEGRKLADMTVAGSTGVGASAAPLVVDGMVITGITGVGYGLHLDSARPDAPHGAVVGMAGRYGRPGFIAAYDATTGKQIWKFDTTREGWEGDFSSKTPDGIPLRRNIKAEKKAAKKNKDAWRYGGGSIWHAPAVDMKRGYLYFGVGNPSPQATGVGRPGDNLYTSSLVAIELKTGRYVWHFQQVPHDVWGYDVASPPVLLDIQMGPYTIPAIAQASKLGWVYVHDRRNGKLLFKSERFVPQKNLFAKATPEGIEIAPGAGGGANWSPISVNPSSGVAFVAAMHMPTTYKSAELPATDDQPAVPYTVLELDNKEKYGTLTALNLKSAGNVVWQHKTDVPLVGGVLATAGNLVFNGEGDGEFAAYNAETGEKLWHFNCGAGVNAPPVSFALDGRQYVAVAAGGSQIWGFRQGGAVIVFGLPEPRKPAPNPAP